MRLTFDYLDMVTGEVSCGQIALSRSGYAGRNQTPKASPGYWPVTYILVLHPGLVTEGRTVGAGR